MYSRSDANAASCMAVKVATEGGVRKVSIYDHVCVRVCVCMCVCVVGKRVRCVRVYRVNLCIYVPV